MFQISGVFLFSHWLLVEMHSA